MVDPKVIVALDYPDSASALEMASKLSPELCRLKVGKELFTSAGPDVVQQCHDLGFEVFLDLKFHDIPNTVAKACKAAANLGVWMLNVHASGGREMMEKAMEAIDTSGKHTLLIAVTVLTSMDQEQFAATGFSGTIEERVEFLARLTQESGLHGVVCSPWEAGKVKEYCGSPFLCVTPGVRPAGANKNDQSRVKTPAKALVSGSDYLVIGRPVTGADDPLAALAEIVKSFS